MHVPVSRGLRSAGMQWRRLKHQRSRRSPSPSVSAQPTLPHPCCRASTSSGRPVPQRPLPKTYQRRTPEATALYAIVRDNLKTFLDDARARHESGAGYPLFVEQEFRRYLGCGILARGFARVRCPSCGFERLVAFSCKGRLCPAPRRTVRTRAGRTARVLAPAAPHGREQRA